MALKETKEQLRLIKEGLTVWGNSVVVVATGIHCINLYFFKHSITLTDISVTVITVILAGIASIAGITALIHYQKEVTDNINRELAKNKKLVDKMVNIGE